MCLLNSKGMIFSVIKIYLFDIKVLTQPLGGIGRRKGLKIPCLKRRPGSSPGVGTKLLIYMIFK